MVLNFGKRQAARCAQGQWLLPSHASQFGKCA